MLSPREQHVVRGLAVEGLSVRDVATALDMQEGQFVSHFIVDSSGLQRRPGRKIGHEDAELIALLAADIRPARPIGRSLLIAGLGGGIAAGLLFVALVGVRSDLQVRSLTPGSRSNFCLPQ